MRSKETIENMAEKLQELEARVERLEKAAQAPKAEGEASAAKPAARKTARK